MIGERIHKKEDINNWLIDVTPKGEEEGNTYQIFAGQVLFIKHQPEENRIEFYTKSGEYAGYAVFYESYDKLSDYDCNKYPVNRKVKIISETHINKLDDVIQVEAVFL